MERAHQGIEVLRLGEQCRRQRTDLDGDDLSTALHREPREAGPAEWPLRPREPVADDGRRREPLA